MNIRTKLKSYVPGWLLQLRRSTILSVAAARNRRRDLRDIFTEVYAKGLWGRRGAFWSGSGSAPERSDQYERIVAQLLNDNPDIQSFIDLGCGDFQVARRVLARLTRPVRYVGVDIVPDLIAYNNESFGSDTVSFVCSDATSDTLPQGDFVAIRQVLQHLSNGHIARVLERVSGFPYILVTEDVPEDQNAPANLDIVSGHWVRAVRGSGVFVDRPPFSLPAQEILNVSLSQGRRMRSVLVSPRISP